jgi:hypothetical protein
VADDVADREADPPLGQRQRLVPVPADLEPLVARPVDGGGRHAWALDEALRQQRALQADCDRVLVAALLVGAGALADRVEALAGLGRQQQGGRGHRRDRNLHVEDPRARRHVGVVPQARRERHLLRGDGAHQAAERDPRHDHERHVAPRRLGDREGRRRRRRRGDGQHRRLGPPLAQAVDAAAGDRHDRARDHQHAEPVADPPAEDILRPLGARAQQLRVRGPEDSAERRREGDRQREEGDEVGTPAEVDPVPASRVEQQRRAGERLGDVGDRPAQRGRDAAAVQEVDRDLGGRRAGQHERPRRPRGQHERGDRHARGREEHREDAGAEPVVGHLGAGGVRQRDGDERSGP